MIEDEDVETFEILLNALPTELLSIEYQGRTLLHVAAVSNNSTFMTSLLNAGACIDSKHQCNDYILHFAAAFSNLENVKMLIERDASILMKNNSGKNAVDFAKVFNRQEMVDFLVNHLKLKNIVDDGEYNNMTIEQMKHQGLVFIGFNWWIWFKRILENWSMLTKAENKTWIGYIFVLLSSFYSYKTYDICTEQGGFFCFLSYGTYVFIYCSLQV